MPAPDWTKRGNAWNRDVWLHHRMRLKGTDREDFTEFALYSSSRGGGAIRLWTRVARCRLHPVSPVHSSNKGVMSSGMMKTHLKKPTGYLGLLLWQEQTESESLKECNEDDCSMHKTQFWRSWCENGSRVGSDRVREVRLSTCNGKKSWT